MDIRVETLKDINLHLRGAEGYKSTELRVSLDGTQDGDITREAAYF